MAGTAASKTTTDRGEIRHWAEDRGAKPSCVRGTGAEGDIGMLRLDFPGYTGQDSLEHTDWDDWFDKFDERGLALVYQETTADGEKSNFNKIVSRQTAAENKPRGKAGSSTKKAASSKKAGYKPASKTAVKKSPPKKKAAPKKKSRRSR